MAQSDPLFGIHPTAMQLQRRRMELIASNLANADTPGFQARDLDFRKILAATQSAASASMNRSAADAGLEAAASGKSLGVNGTVAGPAIPLSEPAYRIPLQPSTDGNTVDTQVEQAQFADAALRYQASLNFLDSRIKGLITALTGE